MRTVPRSAPVVLLLDPEAPIPLYRQIYLAMRRSIVEGHLTAGSLVPSTRALAREFNLSRTTVLQAYDDLSAEGLLQGTRGGGTRVADLSVLRPTAPRRVGEVRDSGAARLASRRAGLLQSLSVGARPRGAPRPFRVGEPALDRFPLALWRRLYGQEWRELQGTRLGAGDPMGCLRLRRVIAASSFRTRGTRVAPEQIFVVRGAQQGIDLAARVLLDPGDAVWVEEPGYLAARAAFLAAGASVIPVPVDDEGLRVESGIASAPHARLAYVTPSHQFPLGVRMSLGRRIELLRWADAAGSWILEDDYDSEFQFEDRPLPALHGLDERERVVYVGTFSKTLFPALRLGYLIVPPDLVDGFAAARALVDQQPSPIDQAVLWRFIEEGHFSRHVRRMRQLYEERRDALLDSARELHPWLRLTSPSVGMHVVGRFAGEVDDVRVAEEALTRGVEVLPLSAYFINRPAGRGLILGFAGVDAGSLRPAVQKLKRVLADT